VFRRRALPIAVATLGALLALLAFLQYRWLGQVSDGERRRMQATLEARGRDFAADFDRELGRVSSAFSMPPDGLASDPSAAFAAAWERWQAAAPGSRLVREVYMVDRGSADLSIRRFDPSSRLLAPSDWPAALVPARERWRAEYASRPSGEAPRLPTRLFVDDLSDVPALVVPPQPSVVRIQAELAGSGSGQVATNIATAVRGTTTLAPVIWLDLDDIRKVVLPALVKKYFATDGVFDYQLSVRLRKDPKQVVFDATVGGGGGDAAVKAAGDKADALVPMFRPRMGDVFAPIRSDIAARESAQPSGAPPPTQAQPQSAYSISVMRVEGSRQPAAGSRAFIAFADTSGGWMLRLVHSSGSLDAAVERLRRRNLVISSSVLGLLAVSLGFVLVTTRRAQRLAAQQVEFVASVSHELRTPLAVIRSAGENLADGVVEAPDQVRRYGALVAEEGRKLGAMVEQVMEFAGMQSDEPQWRKAPTDLRAVVEEAAARVRHLPECGEAVIELVGGADAVVVNADHAALVRAVQNLLENAVKYGRQAEGGPAAARVQVRVTGGPGGSGSGLIEVADEGPGVDARERRRIFEPFVRGRVAAASRVPGNGLGLSIVRRIVEGHGGRVEVRARPEGGAVFLLRLS
jgi:signal transduction histidine kinase